MTAFDDLDSYLALPRVAGLALSPDGTRLVTAVSTLGPERTKYVTALWEVDPQGRRPAHRLTHGAKGEGDAVFLPTGDLLFLSARTDPGSPADADDARPAVWLLPAAGGEARVVATRPGGIEAVSVARGEGTVVLRSPTMPSAVTAADDEKARARRKDAKVTAILHDSYPVRFWDHDLGPDEPRLLAGHVPAEAAAGADPAGADPAGPDPAGPDPAGPDPAGPDPAGAGRAALLDLTPQPGSALREACTDVAPDGRTAVTTWSVPEPGGSVRATLVAVDTGTGERVTLLDDEAVEYARPAVSPDGLRVAVVVETRTTPTLPPTQRVAVLDLASGGLRPVAPGWDRWPCAPVWSPDGTALFVTADDGGRCPVFRIDLGAEPAADVVTRLSTDDGAYGDLAVAPDGRAVYAIRSAVDAAPAPARLDAVTPGVPRMLPAPAPQPDLPGTLTEVVATAADGAAVRAWLALPAGAGPGDPAPLLLWIHGGPLNSWNSWSWRWNPWLMVAQGYAVLLPDPALSTGYGDAFVARGWGAWGEAPYTDLMAVTDAAVARPDVDGTRTAAMGGSFGGYLANWIAGHTDRFAGIVTHASLWALDQFGPTTDAAYYWAREMTPEMMITNSPHRFVAEIRTPMLVVHGDRDYRVPIGEALRLWTELLGHAGGTGTPHRFLYFPDENHWVLGPQHAKVWYSTVLAFLGTTVHGRPWEVPAVLR